MSRIISIESNNISSKYQLLKQLRDEYNNECDGNLYVYIGFHILNLILITTIFSTSAPIIAFYVSCCISYYFYKKNHRVGHCILFLEPPKLSDIFDENGKSILDCYHDNSPKYAFAFYIAMLYERMRQLETAINENPNATIVVCGSIITDREIYIEALHEFGSINTIEYKIYHKWCDAIISCASHHKNTYFVYIEHGHASSDDDEFSQFCNEKYDDLLSRNMPIIQITVNDKNTSLCFSKDIVKDTIKAIVGDFNKNLNEEILETK